MIGSRWTLVLVAAAITTAASAQDFTFKNGKLQRPEGYREWIYVGTPFTPNDMNDGKAAFPEHHNVYMHPNAWEHWKRSGEFKDGTILMKELVSVGSKSAVSGNGYFQGEYLGLEAAIKSRRHFPDEPGNWAYFSFSTEGHKTLKASAKAFPTDACNACHQAAAVDDYVFSQHYPVLRAGKGTGRAAIGGVEDRLSP